MQKNHHLNNSEKGNLGYDTANYIGSVFISSRVADARAPVRWQLQY